MSNIENIKRQLLNTIKCLKKVNENKSIIEFIDKWKKNLDEERIIESNLDKNVDEYFDIEEKILLLKLLYNFLQDSIQDDDNDKNVYYNLIFISKWMDDLESDMKIIRNKVYNSYNY